MSAILADELVKTYPGDVRALDGLSFSVPDGTVFGLLGPNGAGKTTAVKILTTLSRADAGRAEVAGFDVVRKRSGCSPLDRRGRPAPRCRHRADRSREPAPAGPRLRDGRQGARGSHAGAPRPARPRRSGRPGHPWLLRRHAAAARHRAGARPPASCPLPRRADDGPRSRGARGDVAGDRAAHRGRGTHDSADDALPRRGRPAGGRTWRSSTAARSSPPELPTS